MLPSFRTIRLNLDTRGSPSIVTSSLVDRSQVVEAGIFSLVVAVGLALRLPQKKNRHLPSFWTKDSLYSQYNLSFFQKKSKIYRIPCQNTIRPHFFLIFFCFFFFLFNHISYIYIGLEPETKSCVQFLLIPLLTVLKESPWWNHLSLRFPGGSSQGGGNVTSESHHVFGFFWDVPTWN